MISIHSLVKRETRTTGGGKRWRKNFNPLPRKEGDPCLFQTQCRACYFNPLPRKEGDPCLFQTQCRACYFNPLPRKEGDGFITIPPLASPAISIHSLVKRETNSGGGLVMQNLISIHSLVKRETYFRIAVNRQYSKFQSTPS